MSTERRNFERKQPAELSYIQFESEGGGIVLNASEAGLAFHSVSAHEAGLVRLCVSPNPQMQISLTAEIVWMDETKKSGGMRYTNLTADTRNQILAWLTRTHESDVVQKCLSVSFEEMRSAKRLQQNVREENADLFTSTMLNQAPIPQLRTGKRIGTVLFICLLILVSMSFIQIFRPEIGNSLVRLGLKLKGNSDLHQPNSTVTPTPTGVVGSTPSLSEATPKSPLQELSKKQVPAYTARAYPETSSLEIPQPLDPKHVSRHFENLPPGSSPGLSPQQLWSAIAKGDITAEVALARLYLTGKGVPKNCEQARVLLKAASKRGNIEAVQLLGKLKRSRCP